MSERTTAQLLRYIPTKISLSGFTAIMISWGKSPYLYQWFHTKMNFEYWNSGFVIKKKKLLNLLFISNRLIANIYKVIGTY